MLFRSLAALCTPTIELSLGAVANAANDSGTPTERVRRAVIDFPELHFLWVMGSFFLAFYALSAMTDYIAAWMFAFLIGVTVPLWDRYVSGGANVESTLWVALSSAAGILVTLAVEFLASRGKPGDDVLLAVAGRLTAVEEMLSQLAEKSAVDTATEKKLVRLAMRGTSLPRRLLRR